MITTGQELYTFITSLNAEATVEQTLASVLVDTAKAIIEEERPWMVLRKTDISLSVTTSNTWQTAHSLAGITYFSNFYSDFPLRIVNGDLIAYYHRVPFDRRIDYKDTSNTFVYDASTGNIYLNGTVPFAGTIYLNYTETTPAIDLTSSSAIWTQFPARFRALLGFYAIGVYKGAVDYDEINRSMLPENANVMRALRSALEKWDEKQALSEIEHNDPSDPRPYINRSSVHDDRY